MPFLPTANSALALVGFDLNGADATLALNFTKGSAYSSGDLEDLGDALILWQQTGIMPWLSGECTDKDIRLYSLETETAPAITVAPPTPTAGGRSGQQMPNQVAVVITHRTAQRGRSGRGRSYIPGISESDVAGNTVVPAVTAGLLTAFNTGLPLLLPGGTGFVIISKQLNNIRRTAGLAQPVTTSVLRTAFVGTQRRRLGRRTS